MDNHKQPTIYSQDIEVLQFQGTVKSMKEILTAFEMDLSSITHVYRLPAAVVIENDDFLVEDFMAYPKKSQQMEVISVSKYDYVYKYLNGDRKIVVDRFRKFKETFYEKQTTTLGK
jgi:hypothetical protein